MIIPILKNRGLKIDSKHTFFSETGKLIQFTLKAKKTLPGQNSGGFWGYSEQFIK